MHVHKIKMISKLIRSKTTCGRDNLIYGLCHICANGKRLAIITTGH
jgi:hypothetical protein